MKRLIATLAITMLLAACATSDNDPNRRSKKGAVIGGATGAVVGAIIGNQSKDRDKGALLGAAVGAGVGAVIGHMMDKQQAELEQIEGVEVTRTDEDELEIAVRNDVLFDFDSSALRPQSEATLRELSDVFIRYPDTEILVEGHTDSKGSEEYNHALSERRALTVRNYLLTRGVENFRITSIGWGETKPRATNETDEGRQQNRRVEIQIKALPQQS